VKTHQKQTEIGWKTKAIVVFVALSFVWASSAVTVRAKSDLRHWETVLDRASALSWSWERDADAATLTFSNLLTQAVSTVVVAREADARRGDCPHPVSDWMEEGYFSVTLVQTKNGLEIARTSAETAYVPGVVQPGAGMVCTQPITVQTMSDARWSLVVRPSLSAFDAPWWGLVGPSGYEVVWSETPGRQVFQRVFPEVGAVDEVWLRFGMTGFFLMMR